MNMIKNYCEEQIKSGRNGLIVREDAIAKFTSPSEIARLIVMGDEVGFMEFRKVRTNIKKYVENVLLSIQSEALKQARKGNDIDEDAEQTYESEPTYEEEPVYEEEPTLYEAPIKYKRGVFATDTDVKDSVFKSVNEMTHDSRLPYRNSEKVHGVYFQDSKGVVYPIYQRSSKRYLIIGRGKGGRLYQKDIPEYTDEINAIINGKVAI